jgi:hypothetical protein
MTLPISRYGLQKNPYHVNRLESVDLKETYDAEWDPPILVDGFHSLAERGPLEAFLRERSQQGKPAYILIRGPRGTGRTAAARRILRTYFDLRSAELRIAPDIKANNDEAETMTSWLQKVSIALKSAGQSSEGIEKSVEGVAEIEKLNRKYKGRFQNVLMDINKAFGVGAKPSVFGFCLEDPPEGFPVVEVIQDLFESVKTIVIVVVHTSGDEAPQPPDEAPKDPILRHFDELKKRGKGWIFPRSKLETQDLKTLAESYWKIGRKDVTCPIDADTISALGAVTPLPLASVLRVFETALDTKACSPGDGIWPNDPSLRVDPVCLKTIHDTFISTAEYLHRWNTYR